MRRRILASLAKSCYTAKDYVQDGLIAMWDGIESVDSEGKLKDMVNGLNFDISSRTSGFFTPVSGNPHGHAGSMNQDIIDAINSRTISVGIIVKCAGYTPLGRDFFRFNDIVVLRSGTGQAFFRRWFTQDTAFKYYNNDSFIDNEGMIYKVLYATANGTKGEFFALGKNGFNIHETHDLDRNTSPRSFIETTTFDNQIFWGSFKIYNRALTSTEVAANYAIDAARFGLPTA